VLGQLGNRVQHALRAFTPRDQKAVKAAAETFRGNPKIDVETVIGELGVGEALISMLDEQGIPSVVERALVVPPHSQIGAITPDQRKQIISSSVLYGHYENAVDRESAFEKLKVRADEKTQQAAAAEAQDKSEKEAARTERHSKSRNDDLVESVMKSAMRSAGSQLGRQITRGLLGGIFGGKR
jgi:hypothetical protein